MPQEQQRSASRRSSAARSFDLAADSSPGLRSSITPSSSLKPYNTSRFHDSQRTPHRPTTASNMRIKVQTHPPLPVTRFLAVFDPTHPQPHHALTSKILATIANDVDGGERAASFSLEASGSSMLQLSIDGFELIPQDCADLIRDGDLVDVTVKPGSMGNAYASIRAPSRMESPETARPHKRRRKASPEISLATAVDRQDPSSSSSESDDSSSSSSSASASASSCASSSSSSASSSEDEEVSLDSDGRDTLLQANRIAALMRSELSGGVRVDNDDHDEEEGGDQEDDNDDEEYGDFDPAAYRQGRGDGAAIAGRAINAGRSRVQNENHDFPVPPPGISGLLLPGPLPNASQGMMARRTKERDVQPGRTTTIPFTKALGSLGQSSALSAAMTAFEARKQARASVSNVHPSTAELSFPRAGPKRRAPQSSGSSESSSSSGSSSDTSEASSSEESEASRAEDRSRIGSGIQVDASSSSDDETSSASDSDSAPSVIPIPGRKQVSTSVESRQATGKQEAITYVPPGQGKNRTKRRNQKRREKLRQAQTQSGPLAAKEDLEKRKEADGSRSSPDEGRALTPGWTLDFKPSNEIDAIVAKPSVNRFAVDHQDLDLPPGGGSLGITPSTTASCRERPRSGQLVAVDSRASSSSVAKSSLEEIAARMLSRQAAGPITRKITNKRPKSFDDTASAMSASQRRPASESTLAASDDQVQPVQPISTFVERPIAGVGRMAKTRNPVNKRPVPPPSQRPPSEIPSCIKVTSIDCINWYNREYERMQQEHADGGDQVDGDEEEEDEATRAYHEAQRQVKEKLAARKREEALQKRDEAERLSSGSNATQENESTIASLALDAGTAKQDEREVSIEISPEKRTLKIRPQQGRAQQTTHTSFRTSDSPATAFTSATDLDYGDPDDSAVWVPRKKPRKEGQEPTAESSGRFGDSDPHISQSGGDTTAKDTSERAADAESTLASSIGRMQQLLSECQDHADADPKEAKGAAVQDETTLKITGKAESQGQGQNVEMTELERARQAALATLRSRSQKHTET